MLTKEDQIWIKRAPGSGRPRTTRTAENVDAVGGLGTEPAESTPDKPLYWKDLTRAWNTSNK